MSKTIIAIILAVSITGCGHWQMRDNDGKVIASGKGQAMAEWDESGRLRKIDSRQIPWYERIFGIGAEKAIESND